MEKAGNERRGGGEVDTRIYYEKIRRERGSNRKETSGEWWLGELQD